MVEKKVTTMVLKVDLKCDRCYKKIKKVLCKFPQIKDQVYDEKQNTVTIKVLCCCPEKIKQKIICKAGTSLLSIEIKVPVVDNSTSQPPTKNSPPRKITTKPRTPEPVPECKVKLEIELVTPPCSCPGQRCNKECSEGRPCRCGGKGIPCQPQPAPAPPCHQCDGCCQCHRGRPPQAPCDGGCYLVYYEDRPYYEPCSIM